MTPMLTRSDPALLLTMEKDPLKDILSREWARIFAKRQDVFLD
jgi:hypothetical protein